MKSKRLVNIIGSLLLMLGVATRASVVLMGQSEVAQTFPHAVSIYFPFIGNHPGSTTATGSQLGYATTITGLTVTDAPQSASDLNIRLVNLTTLQANGIDPGSDFTTWPAGSNIGCGVTVGIDGCSVTQNFTVAATDQLIIRVQAASADVTLYNHVIWYIPQ